MTREDTKRRPLLRFRYVVVSLTALTVYFGCPFRIEVVRGDSMKPTLRDGALCVLDRTCYANHPMARGDVVSFRMGDSLLTKRVYGAPGDAVELIRYPSDSSYGLPEPRLLPKLRRFAELSKVIRSKWTPYLMTLAIPAGKCFVVGDNRASSYDSRNFGLIDTTTVIGKMVAPASIER